MNKLLIDSCALVLLIVGELGEQEFERNTKTDSWEYDDYQDLADHIQDYSRLIVLPNVWTEVDNLLNRLPGDLKYEYILNLKTAIGVSTEIYLPSISATKDDLFYILGITDTLLKICALNGYSLVTADSELSDYAKAYGIDVFDLVALRNEKLFYRK